MTEPATITRATERRIRTIERATTRAMLGLAVFGWACVFIHVAWAALR